MADELWPWRGVRSSMRAVQVLAGSLAPESVRQHLTKRRTRQVLQHALRTVPAMRLKLDVDNLERSPRLRDFPATTRTDLLELPGAAHISTAATLVGLSDMSSGTTGPRVPVLRDALDIAVGDAIWIRTYARFGWSPRMRRARLRHPDPATDHQPMSGLRARLGLPQPIEISTALPVEAQADALLRYCPDLIHGSPHEIAAVCTELARRAVRLSSPSAVVCAGEPLYSDVAELIRDRLSVRPHQVYGTAEAGLIGWSCDAGSLHCNSDVVVTELTNDGSDGRANLWVTTLLRHAMPLIRFATGDVVLPPATTACACTSSWPVLGDLLGPESSFLELPGGRRIPGRRVAGALAGLGGSHCFAMVQPTSGPVVVDALSSVVRTSRDRRGVRHALHVLVGGELEFDVRGREALSLGATGKYALVRRASEGGA